MGRTKRVWFLVSPGTGLLNVAGPWETLGHANDLLGHQAYQLEAFGPEGPSTTTRHGLLLGGLRPLPRPRGRFADVVVVAGGSPREPLSPGRTAIVAWLRQHRPRLATTVSICTGAFLLGAAGLLDGRRATTHWLYLDELRKRFPKATAVDQGVFVKDGPVWTSAGIMAGVDLTLALIEEHHGHQLAMNVAKRMVLFLRRSGYQSQFSSALQRQEKEPPRRLDVSAFVVEHLDESLPVERVAAGVGMSVRSLSRWCRENLHESPAELVRRLRLEEARRLLEETSLPLKAIGAQTGLGDTSTLWRVFVQSLGVTPADYRQRFAPLAAAG